MKGKLSLSNFFVVNSETISLDFFLCLFFSFGTQIHIIAFCLKGKTKYIMLQR